MRYLLSLIMSALLSSPTAAFAGYENTGVDSIRTGYEGRYGHLEYFGFYASAMRQWNYSAELAPFTNLTWIEVPDIDEAVRRISEARENRLEAVLSLQSFIFDAEFNVKPGFEASLAELQQRLEFEGLTDSLAMLYPVDEPYLRASNSEKTNRKTMYLDLLSVNREVRDYFPGIPIGVIFNNKEVLRRDFRIPPSYRWVGFDCYENMYDCKGKPFVKYYSVLLEKMTHKQRLIAVAQSWVKYSDYERDPYEPDSIHKQRTAQMIAGLERRLKHHYEIALSEPRFIAFIPFIWSMEAAQGQAPHAGFGVERFAQMFPSGGQRFTDALKNIGREIKSGDVRYPNLGRQHTEFSLRRPPNRYEGGIVSIGETGLVSGWAMNRALPHKNLRMQTVVTRNEKVIYSSRVRRSFILDESLRPGFSPKLPVVGIHGYRQQLPRWVFDEVRTGEASVRLRVFGDTAGQQEYSEISP